MDVMPVKEKGSNKLKIADKDGKSKTVKPEDGDNPDLFKINMRGNLIENFFENFKRQVKDPTRFEFFRVPAEKFREVVNKLQDAFKNPDKPKNKKFLDMHRVEPEDFLKKQAEKQTAEQTQSQPQTQSQVQTQGQPQTASDAKTYAISPDLVDWGKFERFGVSRESLEKSGNLDKLLDYQKTNLLPVSMKFDGETLRSDARFSLRKQDDGTFAPAIHLIRNKPDLESPHFGIRFTEEDKQNLQKTGNLGRIIEPEYPNGKIPVYLSVDRLTNELVAVRANSVKIPEVYQSITLNEQQKRELSEGKAVYLENMKNSRGESYSGNIQYNADKRYFAKISDFSQKQYQTQSQTQKQSGEPGDVQKTFRGRELTADQRDSLREGKTVYVDGLKDRNGKGYSGYITLDRETGKSDFMFSKQYKDALAAGKVIPDDRHKVQVAKNSEGKTTEAVKNIKEPLNREQTQPTEKQAEK
jgi:hypothetical protein